MIGQFARPKNEVIENAYNRLYKSSATLSKLRDAALGGRLLTPSGDGFEVAGRSMAWKLFLCPGEPLRASAESTPPFISLETWRDLRKAYVDLLLARMRAPDGSYEEGLVIPGHTSLPKRGQSTAGNLEKNNPLSLHDENPWNAWFASVELRKTILQDVERTFPDVAYFRDPEVQSHLTNILFVYSVENPTLGYRQGMHELLAPILYAVDFDSLADGQTHDQTLSEFCSRMWVAADSYALFLAVMSGAGRWYGWREHIDPPKSPLATHMQIPVSHGQFDLKPYVAPIVEACNRLQSSFLKSVDPDLWRCIQAAGIEPQIYGIRWLRLLFTREFNMSDSMILWDGLFACDPSFDLALWICVAMLIRIRNRLMPADYSEQLTYLLRYPTPPALAPTPEWPSAGNHINLLLRQAVTLQMAPSVSSGAAVVYENRNLLNIPIEVPDLAPPPARRRPQMGERGRSDGASRKSEHSRIPSSSMGLPELIARGLLDRGESLGINKTVMNAVSELKRNLPDLAASFNVPANQPSSFQLLDERPPEARPAWEPKTRFAVEKEVAEGKSLQRKLGDSVEWIVDVLLQDEGSTDPETLKLVRQRKREALESLAYVRDVLKGRTTVVDEEQLFSVEEMVKRNTHVPRSISPPAPPPVSVGPRLRSSQESMSSNGSRRPSQSSPPRKSSTQSPWMSFADTNGTRPPPSARPLMSYPPSVIEPPSEQAPRSKIRHDPLGVL